MKRSPPVDDAGAISTDLLASRTSFEVKFFFSRIPKKYTPQKALFLPEMPAWLFLLNEVLKALFRLVCYTAVFRVVTQRSSPALRDDSKNGCVADYISIGNDKISNIW